MDRLDADQLSSLLQTHRLSSSICEKLKDELIDGENFLKMDEKLLRALNFKGMEIIKILEIQRKLSSDPSESCFPGEDKENIPPPGACCDVVSSELNSSGDMDLYDVGSAAANAVEIDDANFIKKYFTSEEYFELSDYEVQNMRSRLERYNFAVASGQPHAHKIKPDFVVRHEAAQAQKAVSKSKTPVRLSPIRRSNRLSTVNVNRISSPCEAPTLANLSSSQNDGCFAPTSASAGLSSGSNASPGLSGSWIQPSSPSCSFSAQAGPSIRVSSGGQLSSRFSAPQPNLITVASAASGSLLSARQIMPVSEPEVQGSTSGGNRASAASGSTSISSWPNDRLQEITCLKPDLPMFDLDPIVAQLASSKKTKPLHAKLLNQDSLTEPERKELVRLLTKWLYHTHAESPNHVTTEMREGLAKSMLIKWPTLYHHDIPACADESLFPWSHIYNVKSNTGWIANAARPIQAKHRCRKTKETLWTANDTDDENPLELMEPNAISQLAIIFPGQRQKPEIMQGMKSSFLNREKDRYEGKSITEIMRVYPHFASFGGEIISEEFYTLKPKADDMCKTFLVLLPKILALPEKRPMSYKFNNDIVKALSLIAQNLPHDIPTKDETKFVTHSWAQEEDLFVVKQTGDNLEDYVIERRAKTSGPVQPYLIIILSTVTQKILKTFIVLDEKVAELNVGSPLKALDILIQSYFIFNVKFPFGWRNCLTFIQLCLYKIHETNQKQKGLRPCDIVLWKKINQD